jgi:hypothetical protein
MATGGDDTAIVDQDEDPKVETKQVGAAEDESGWLDDDKDQQQGVGRPRKQSKRNAAGILRIDTTAAAAAAGFNSRRKSSASSVGDFRSGATYLNPQVRQNEIKT